MQSDVDLAVNCFDGSYIWREGCFPTAGEVKGVNVEACFAISQLRKQFAFIINLNVANQILFILI